MNIGPPALEHRGDRLRRTFNRRSVRLAIAVLVLAALLWKIDRARLGELLGGFDLATGFLMVAINLVLTALFAGRWWLIGTALGVAAPYATFARALWLSQCVGELGPALVIGEVARFRMLLGFGDQWALAASQAIDRLSGKLVLLAIVALLTPLYVEWYAAFPFWQIGVVALLLAAAVTIAVWFARRVGPVARLRATAVAALTQPKAATLHYGLSLLIQILLAGNLALAATGLGVPVDAATRVFLLAPLVLLGVGVLPGMVSDWGKREAVALALLSPAGLTPEQSVAVSLVYGLSHLVAVLPAAPLLLSRPRRPVC